MVDLILRDMTIGFGQLSHGNEYGFQKNGLTQGVLQGVYSARTVGTHPIKECATQESDDGSDVAKEQIAYNNTNELEQGDTRSLIKLERDYNVYGLGGLITQSSA